MIHYFGCNQSWDHRIQEDFVNLLISNNHVNSWSAHFDEGYQKSKWAEPEIKVCLLNICHKNEESNLEMDQLQTKLLGSIGHDLISQIDQMTIFFRLLTHQPYQKKQH